MADLCRNIAPLRASASSSSTAAVTHEEDDEDLPAAQPSVPELPPPEPAPPQPDAVDAERVRLLGLLHANRGFVCFGLLF